MKFGPGICGAQKMKPPVVQTLIVPRRCLLLIPDFSSGAAVGLPFVDFNVMSQLLLDALPLNSVKIFTFLSGRIVIT